MDFLVKSIHNFTDSDYPSNQRKSMCKKLEATQLFVDFSKVFVFIHRRKMEQTLLTYCLLKETVTAIMILFKSTKANVQSSGSDINFFDILAKVYISAIFVYTQPRQSTSNVDRSNKRKWLCSKKGKKQTRPSRNYNRRRLRWLSTTSQIYLPT